MLDMNKHNLTKNILNNISNKILSKNNNSNDTTSIKPVSISNNQSLIVIPVNNDQINEVLKYLQDKGVVDNQTKDNKVQENKVSDNEVSENIPKKIITQNDLTKLNVKELVIDENTIITPLARDTAKTLGIKIIKY
jgi:hypothetical protein